MPLANFFRFFSFFPNPIKKNPIFAAYNILYTK